MEKKNQKGGFEKMERKNEKFSLKGLLSFLIALVLLFVFVSQSVSADVTVAGDSFQPSTQLYLNIYDTGGQANPCTGVPTSGSLLLNRSTLIGGGLAPDTNYNDGDDYSGSFAWPSSGNIYMYVCNGAGAGLGNLLAYYNRSVTNGQTYQIDIATVYGNSLHSDLNGDNVVICDELDGTKLSSQARQVSGQAYDQFYFKDETSGAIQNYDVYVLITANGDNCTFNSSVHAARKINILDGSSINTYGVAALFAPDTKFTADLHAELGAAKLSMFDANSVSVGIGEGVAAPDGEDDGNDDLTTYYDNPGTAMTWTLEKSGKTTQTLTNVPSATSNIDFVVHVKGTVPTDVNYIEYDNAQGTTYTHYTVPSTQVYDLYVPDDAASVNEKITMKTGGASGTTVITIDNNGPKITADATCTLAGANDVFAIGNVNNAGDNDWDGTGANTVCPTVSVAKVSGALDENFETSGANEKVEVIDTWVAGGTMTYNTVNLAITPTGNQDNEDYKTYFIIYYLDDGSGGLGTQQTTYDMKVVASGSSDYTSYINDSLTGVSAGGSYDKDLIVRIYGTVPDGSSGKVDRVYLVDSGAPNTALAITTPLADGTYRIYTIAHDAGAGDKIQFKVQEPADENNLANNVVLLIDSTSGQVIGDETFNVAKVTGSENNIHDDLNGNKYNVRVKDAAADNSGAYVSSVWPNIDPGNNGDGGETYTTYFEVPSDGLVNFEVYDTTASNFIYFVYNVLTAGGETYTFEPNAKLTATVTANGDNVEVVSDIASDIYKVYRDNNDETTKVIYIDSHSADRSTEAGTQTGTTDTTGTYNLYTDDSFTTLVLSRNSKVLTANSQTWNVAKVIGDVHPDLSNGEANDNIEVYDDAACTTVLSSEDIAITAGAGANDDYTQYFESDAAGNVYLKITENDGTNDYITCYNTEQADPGPGGSVTQDLEVKVSGNVGSGITTVLFDNDGDHADYEVVATVQTAITPDSYKAYWAGDTDTDVLARAGATNELIREGKNYGAPGSYTFNIGKVTISTHTDLESGDDNLAVYSDNKCTTEVSSSWEGGLTEKFGNAANTNVYFEGSDGTDYYVRAQYDTGANEWAICRTVPFQLTNQEYSTVSFDYKVSGNVPDYNGLGAVIGAAYDISSVAIDLDGGSDDENDYWVNVIDTGNYQEYYLYVSDSDTDNDLNFWGDAGAEGKNLLRRTNVNTATDPSINVLVFYGEAHGNLEDGSDYVKVCDGAITSASQAGDCSSIDLGYRSTVSGNGVEITDNGFGGTADYVIHAAVGTDSTYYLEFKDDAGTANYYSYLRVPNCDKSGADTDQCNGEADGRLYAEVEEAFDGSTGINDVKCDVGDDNIANVLAFGYTIGGDSGTPGKCNVYADAGVPYDFRFSKGAYITQDYSTNGDGSKPDLNDETLDKSFNQNPPHVNQQIQLVSGVKVIVREYVSNNLVTDATVTIYNCSGATVSTCTTDVASCTQPNGPCIRNGDNTVGNGLNGEYYFSGIPTGSYVQIKINKTSYAVILDPDPIDPNNPTYQISSTTVQPDGLATPYTYFLMNPVPGKVSLRLPTDGSYVTTSTTPTLYWYDLGEGETAYYIEVDNDYDFSSVVASGNVLGNVNQWTVSSALTEGTTYYWRVRAYDGVNYGTWSDVWRFIVDTQAPTFTSTTGTSFNTRSVLLTGTTNEAATCRFDTTDVAYGSMAYAFGNLDVTTFAANYFAAEGSNTLYVRCKDTAGNVMTSSTQITFTVDSVAPYVTAATPQGGYYTSPATISVTTNEDSTCKYDTQDIAYGSMANIMTEGAGNVHTATPTPASDGLIHYYIRCKDDSQNNEMTSSVLVYYIYDSTNPSTPSLISPSSGSRLNSAPTLVWSESTDLNGVSYYVLELDKETDGIFETTYNVYTTSYTLTGAYWSSIPEGATAAWKVKAVDYSGRSSAYSTVFFFTKDTTAPTFTSTTGTSFNTRSVLLTGTTNEAATCRFDTTDVAYGSMAYAFGNIDVTTFAANYFAAEGSNTLYVRCKDTAGNVMTSSTQITFIVDSTAPLITASSPQGGYKTAVPVTLSVTTNEAATCKYDTQDREYGSMANTFSTTGGTTHTTGVSPSDGTYHYYVRCQDSYGNVMLASTVLYFTLDTVVPTYSIVSVDPSIAKQGTEVTVTFLASEELKAAINPTVTIGGLSATLYARDGKYFVYKRTLTGSEANGEIVISGGEDLAGNTATQLTNSLLLMVDFVAPTITGTAPTGTLNTGSVTLMVNTSENAICKFSEFNVGYDTMDMMAGSGTEHVKTLYGLPSGGYTFYFRCRDTAGNEGNLATTTFTIDRTAPTILDAEPEEGIYTTIPQLRILVDENAVCRWANHTGTFANMPSSNEFTVNANVWKTITEGTPTASYIEDAENKFWVICKDNYGNEMTQPIVIAFLLNAQDNEAPYIVSSAPNGTINDSTPTLMVVTNENANCQYSTREFDYGSGTAFTTTGGTTHTVTLSELADGQYAYYVRCQDTSGNKMTQSTVIIFTIDTRDRCFYYKDLVTPWTAHFDLPPDMNGSALYNLALDPTKNTYRVVDVLNSSLGNNLASVWWYNTTRNSWMVYFHNIDPNTKLGLINLGIWIETMRNTGEQYWIRIYTPPARVCIPKQ